MSYAREIYQTLKEAGNDWIEDKALEQGAALAFYSMLSIAPLLVICIALAALVFGEKAARGQIAEELQGLMGVEGAIALQAMVENSQTIKTGSLAAALAVAILLFGASGVFAQLQTSLNTIWDAPARVGWGIWALLRDRCLSFTMVLGTGFLLLASLVLSAVIAGAGAYFGAWWPGLESLWQFTNSLVTIVMATLLFALIFKVLPDVRIGWRDVWVGAVLTAILFTFGKLVIGLYLGKSGIASAYGAGGSLVVLVLWLYYSAQILLFGAELTHVYSRRYGSRVPSGQPGTTKSVPFRGRRGT
jgi:membrane protein